MNKILKSIMLVILVLPTLYLGYVGVITYKYNHVYTTEQKINYIRNHYMHIGFPRTNEKLLKSKEFKDNHVKFYPAKSLEPGTDGIVFYTKHFVVYCDGNSTINRQYIYDSDDNTIYDYYTKKEVKDKKLIQMMNKELKEFTDKFGKNMGYQSIIHFKVLVQSKAFERIKPQNW